MKKIYLLLICIISGFSSLPAQGVPELMYYKFDGSGTSVPNQASMPVGTNPATFVGGMIQGPTGLFGNGLIGTGGISTTDYVDTGWPTSLSGDWTIAFWTSNIQPSATLWYIFGDNTAGTFRCFTNGVAGANNWMLRGAGITDVTVTGAATTTPNMVHFVYDGTANEIRGYVDGVLNTTVAQAPGLTITGTGPFKVGGYGGNSGLSPAGVMDEFRIYNRAVPLAEIQATFNQTLPLITGPYDIALAGISSPTIQIGSCYGATETITTTLYSFGTDTLDLSLNNVKVTINTTGPNPQSYSTTLTSGIMVPGSSMPVTLTTMYDMSAGGIHTFNGYAEFLTGGPDANLANDTLSTVNITNFSVNVLPGVAFMEDFETFTAGGAGTGTNNGWSILNQSASTTVGWTVELDGVFNSGGTGPLDDHTPGGQTYLYTETSGGAAGDTFNLYSPCISLTGVTAPKLSFWYHMFGPLMGTLNVVVPGGSSTGADTTIFTISGQQQTAETDPWLEAIVDLSFWSGSIIQLNFQAIHGGVFTSDLSLDDINIFEPAAFDVAGLNMTSPDAGCGLGAAETICFDYFNNGSDTLTALTASYSINNGPYIPVEAISGTLLPGATANYCFTTTADLSPIGLNEVVIVVTQASPVDGNPINDTIITVIETKAIISTYPYFQDFESAAWVPDPNLSPGAPIITLPEGWENSQADAGQDWAVFQGATSSGFTGPDQDHTTGIGKYLLVEDTGFDNDSIIAISPCFDVSALISPKFSFWYHSNNENNPTDENELHIDLIFNGTLTFDIIPPIAHKDNNWNLVEIDLSAYPGVLSVRFRVNNNNNLGNHDIAIDDVNLVDVLPQDVGINTIAAPVSGCGLLANDTLLVGLVNLGTDTVFGGFFVNYSINGGAPVSVPFTDTVLAGFPVPVVIPGLNLATPGTYTIAAWTSGLAGDTNAFNDSAFSEIISSPSIATFPYSEDFENGPAGWSVEIPVGTSSSWSLGTPAKQVIQGAASGVNAWVTAVDSTVINLTNVPAEYSNQENGWVVSPCFDFSGMNAPTLQMSVWWECETSWDGAVVQYTIDGGGSWLNVGAFGDPDNWYNDNTIDANPGGQMEGWSGFGADGSGGWVIAKSRMDSLAGEPEVRFRVVFSSDQFVTDDGIAFDDIFIFDTPTDDVGVLGFTDPVSGICGDDSTLVQVILTNFGIDTAANIPVFVDVTGAGAASLNVTFPGPLAPGDSASVAMGYINTTAGGQFILSGYTAYLGDTLLFNDTTVFTLEVTAIPPAPIAVDDSVVLCVPDSVMLMVLNDTNFTYIWYDSIGGAPLVVDTNVFQTPFLTTDQTYYVSASQGGSSSLVISEMDLGAPDVLEIMNASPGAINATGWSVATSNSYTNINLANTITQSPGIMGPAQVKHWDDAAGSPQYWGNNLFYNPGAFPGFAGWAMIIDDLGNVVDAIFWGWDAASIATFNTTIAGFTITAADIPWTGDGIDASTTTGPLTRQGSVDSDDATDWVTNLPITAGTQNPGLSSIVSGSGSGGGCPSELTQIKVLVSPDVPVDLGPDGVECSGFVLNAFDPGFASYTWNTGATVSSITADTSGLYFVDVVNTFGCTGSDSIFLTINPSPSVDLGPQDTTVCDLITLDAGNAGATFVWSEPGQFGQTIDVTQSGQYYVTVNSLGCEGTDTINVTVNTGPVLDLGSDLTSCVDLTLDAGNPGSTYAWSTGATSQTITVSPPAMGSDTVSVLVTNASLCDAFDEIIISAGVPPVVDLGPDVTNCDSVVLDAGVAGATYTWSSGQTTQTISVTASGTYSVEVIDGSGCDAADTVDVTVEQKPDADFVWSNSGFTIDFTNTSIGGVSYAWDFGDTNTSTDENPTHTYQFPGSYEVTLIVSNACGSDTFKTLVNGLDIDNEAFGRMIELYPNPTKGEFFVSADDFTAEELTIKVTDTRGRIVYNEVNENVFGGFRIRVDLGAEAEGVYLVEISDGENTTYKRVIRE